VQADAQIDPFEADAFDVAIGRTSAMFFADRVAALANVGRALRTGGRLVLLVWQGPSSNEWFLELTEPLSAGRYLPPPPPGGPHPFTLADPAVARDVLPPLASPPSPSTVCAAQCFSIRHWVRL
jgi:SAM-dependent methyltransferase